MALLFLYSFLAAFLFVLAEDPSGFQQAFYGACAQGKAEGN